MLTVPVPQLLPPVLVGGLGIALTTTFVVAVALHPELITVTVYTPTFAVWAFVIVGFCKVELKLLGPDHE